MAEKTLGQIAYESMAGATAVHPWSELDMDTRQVYEASAQAVRKATLEEATASIEHETKFFTRNGKMVAKQLTLMLQNLIGDSNA